MSVCTWTIGRRPTSTPASTNASQLLPPDDAPERTSRSTLSAVANPKSSVRCGSHHAMSGVYHCMFGSGAVPPSDGRPS